MAGAEGQNDILSEHGHVEFQNEYHEKVFTDSFAIEWSGGIRVKIFLNMDMKLIKSIWQHHAKLCLGAYADSEGPDQPAHSRSLIRAFTVR